MNKRDRESALGTLDMRRDFVEQVGVCDFCREDIAEQQPEDELILRIDGVKFAWNMCEYHEGELMRRLINNFVKRRTKKRPGGYKGPFHKQDVCELCFDLMEQNEAGTLGFVKLWKAAKEGEKK